MKKIEDSPIKLELLSPARDLKTGRIAILAGADAVYIGGPDFSARAAASNNWADIKALVDFAHQYYAKVYLALNTIIFDNELSAARAAAEEAYKIGVDALIIQDLAFLEMNLPPIRLFASTQTDNYDLDRIKFLAEAGLERIILARELSLEEIENIRKNIDKKVELEAFVHGALCVSFSGRCYFSQALSGRSANRGQCQQVCRLPFDLVDADGKVLARNKYLLSLKDLNLSNRLGKLAEAGISSFKIEGRLKDEAYVGNVTAYYRQELDKVIASSDGKYARASSGQVELNFEPDLDKTFNRGYTEYFFNGRQGEVVSPDSQKSLGEYIGTVKRIGYDRFVISGEHDLKNGDGICWFDEDGQLVGTNINIVEDGHIYTNRLLPWKEGVEIYRNQNLSFEKAAANGSERRIGLSWEVGEAKDGFKIKAIDEDGNEAEMDFKYEKVLAEKEELAEGNWRKQLSKLGETIFYGGEVKFKWHKPFFAPLSVINEWRREVAAKLVAERLKNYPRQLRGKKAPAADKNALKGKALDYSYNIANKLAKDFYEKRGAKVVEEAFEKQKDASGKILMTTKHCLKHWLGACPKCNGEGATGVSFNEPLYLVQSGKKYELRADCQNCRMEICHP